MLKPFKFVVQAVILDERDGVVRDELVAEPVTVFSVDGLREWVDSFEDELVRLQGDRERGVE